MGIASDIGLDKLGIGNGGNIMSGISGFVHNLIIFIIFAAILGAIIYFMHNKKVYCEKIQIFEEVNGNAVPTKSYLAKEVILPNTSIKIFRLKTGMYLPRPTIQTGKKNWIFFIRDDHEWVNIGIENLNKKLTDLKIRYNHVDMRLSNASLKELIKTNYGDNNWLKKYGAYIALGALVVVMGISWYLVADKQNETMILIDNIMARNEALTRELIKNGLQSGIKIQ